LSQSGGDSGTLINADSLTDVDMADAMKYTDHATASNKATFDKKAKKKELED